MFIQRLPVLSLETPLRGLADEAHDAAAGTAAGDDL